MNVVSVWAEIEDPGPDGRRCTRRVSAKGRASEREHQRVSVRAHARAH